MRIRSTLSVRFGRVSDVYLLSLGTTGFRADTNAPAGGTDGLTRLPHIAGRVHGETERNGRYPNVTTRLTASLQAGVESTAAGSVPGVSSQGKPQFRELGEP